jgi:hypothetical protein
VRRQWYKHDLRFGRHEAAIDLEGFKRTHRERFELVREVYGGNLGFLLVFNSSSSASPCDSSRCTARRCCASRRCSAGCRASGPPASSSASGGRGEGRLSARPHRAYLVASLAVQSW